MGRRPRRRKEAERLPEIKLNVVFGRVANLVLREDENYIIMISLAVTDVVDLKTLLRGGLVHATAERMH